MFNHSIDMEIGFFENLISILESGLKKAKKDLEGVVDKSVKNMTEDQKAEYLDVISDEFWELDDVTPPLMRQAVFVAGYSWIESALHKLCWRAYRDKVSIVEPKAQEIYIHDSQKYLETKAGLTQSELACKWDTLHGYRMFRNIMVHNEGHLKEDDKKCEEVKCFIGRTSHVSIKNSKEIVIEWGFNQDFLEFAQQMLHDITNRLLKKKS